MSFSRLADMADTLRPLNSNTGRRRTIVRLTPNSNTRNKPFDRQSLDRGEHPESGRPPRHFKLENSYRMKPEASSLPLPACLSVCLLVYQTACLSAYIILLCVRMLYSYSVVFSFLLRYPHVLITFR